MLRGLTIAAALGVLLAQTPRLNYPHPPKGNQVDTYHGRAIRDPFRQLEDPNNPATRAWIDAEQKLTEDWLARIPQRESIRARLRKLYDYDRTPASMLTNFSRPFPFGYAGAFSAGSRHFLMRNNGLQSQSVLYTVDAQGNNAKVLLDPNTLRADGTAALCGLSPSHDGKLLAYGLALAGSDWCQWRIREVDSGRDLPDLIPWTKDAFPAWTPDNTAFYYTRYPKPADDQLLSALNRNPRVMRHRIGEPDSRDQFIYEDMAHPAAGLGPVLTGDGRFLLVHADIPDDSSKSMLSYEDLSAAQPKMSPLTPVPAGLYGYVGSRGSIVYIQTTDGAPKGRIIAIDLRAPGRNDWKTVIAEQPDNLETAIFADGKFLLSFLKDAHSEAKLFSVDGQPWKPVVLEGIGSVTWSPAEPGATELYYSFTGFTSPAAQYRLDLRTGAGTLLRRSRLPFDSNNFETLQVFYRSKDSTRVPLFLTHKRGIPLDGRNPALLYGYGGFDVAMTPSFTPSLIHWMELGGVFAEVSLRGGSEYGEAWHLAGAGHHKQNVFDDFIAAAQWLIDNKYTSTPKLAIYGGSNGGLLVGACLNQRPDLFGAAMPAVGVMDMLRFPKFTSGAGWVSEYGSPDNAVDFPVLLAYSPLHNIRNGVRYPATLITTSDHDDRVVPGHSFKYAATLQAAQAGPAPILIRIETRAGHGAGKPTNKTINEWTDRFAFLVKTLGMP